ncbi:MAG: hypothetical protein P8Y58_06935 [Novosphingobium sp.]
MLFTLPFAAACTASTAEKETASMIAPPSTELSQPMASDDPAAIALTNEVARHVTGTYRIENARYFKLDKSIGWNQVQKHVANLRSKTGMPRSLPFATKAGRLFTIWLTSIRRSMGNRLSLSPWHSNRWQMEQD